MNGKNRKKLLKPALSIDFGSRAIKVVEGRFRNGILEIDKYDSCNFYSFECANGKILEPATIANSIRDLISRNHMTAKQAIFTINSTDIVMREMLVPQIKVSDLIGLVTYEMGEYLPIDVSSYSIQYKIIDKVQLETEIKLKLSVCAVPKSIIEPLIRLCGDLNLEPLALDVSSNAIEKLASLESGQNSNFILQNKNIAFVNMGHGFFDITIFDSGIYQFNKILDVGSKMLEESISGNLNINAKEAERIKKENFGEISVLDMYKKYGRYTNNINDSLSKEEQLMVEIIGIIDTWVIEVESIIQYYNTRNKDSAIDQIYLYGGTASMKNIDKFFETRLRIRTNLLDQLNCLQIKQVNQEENIMVYLNAFGGLLRNS